jgi:hypothetical protein
MSPISFFDQVARAVEATGPTDHPKLNLYDQMRFSKVFEVIHDEKLADKVLTEEQRIWFHHCFVLPFKRTCIEHIVSVGALGERRKLVFLEDPTNEVQLGIGRIRRFACVSGFGELIDAAICPIKGDVNAFVREDAIQLIERLGEAWPLPEGWQEDIESHLASPESVVKKFVDSWLVCSEGEIQLGDYPSLVDNPGNAPSFPLARWFTTNVQLVWDNKDGRRARAQLHQGNGPIALCAMEFTNIFYSSWNSMIEMCSIVGACHAIGCMVDLMLLNTPQKFIMEARPIHYDRALQRSNRSGKIMRMSDRPRYIILKPNEIRRAMQIPSETRAPTGRRILYRRAHWKFLRAERYVSKRFSWVRVKPVWPHNTEAVIDNVRYRVHLGYRPGEDLLTPPPNTSSEMST